MCLVWKVEGLDSVGSRLPAGWMGDPTTGDVRSEATSLEMG